MTGSRRRWAWGVGIAAGTAGLLSWMPLFHVVPFPRGDAPQQSSAAATFDPVAFVDEFWTTRLIPGSDGAVDALELVSIIQQDHHSARKTHGHSVGLGSTYYYFIAGTGNVVSVDKNSIGLSLQEDQTQIPLVLETGNIFGNAVRDGTGLLDVNGFANSQDFNSVSSQINGRIETNVLPGLRKIAKPGVKLRFVGCVEITDEDTDLKPLRVVPFIIEAG
ncbi:hypothetical protein K227x_20740 [Rubripirellula lacrimiformis]|uniref:Periplasmic lipoprotein n=1 Tax=Rubripirellula lacrimiformis TaxID=1930273 RepID=A0A517N971_9BACT|nr:DUF2291 family protein [Rubripirellula lacrimiformis]QDT03690.1 hypothetical protein K227x_20740 [Rubripirellula lacrimiformis]